MLTEPWDAWRGMRGEYVGKTLQDASTYPYFLVFELKQTRGLSVNLHGSPLPKHDEFFSFLFFFCVCVVVVLLELKKSLDFPFRTAGWGLVPVVQLAKSGLWFEQFSAFQLILQELHET